MRRIFILLGPPGVGKGTVARGLVDAVQCRWLSSGDLLRDIKRTGSEIGRAIAELIDVGQFVPDELIIGLMQERLDGCQDACLMLDGFPRTLAQAKSLDEWSRSSGEAVQEVFEMRASSTELEARILKRSAEQERNDDTLATFRRRMEVYRERTAPLIAYYENQGKLVVVDAMGPPDEVQERISRRIQNGLPVSSAESKKEAG